jgi:hypothetical protein
MRARVRGLSIHHKEEIMKSGKSSKSAKKLNLSRETIKKLSESDLEGVQGAQMKTSETGGNCYSLMIDGCG